MNKDVSSKKIGDEQRPGELTLADILGKRVRVIACKTHQARFNGPAIGTVRRANIGRCTCAHRWKEGVVDPRRPLPRSQTAALWRRGVRVHPEEVELTEKQPILVSYLFRFLELLSAARFILRELAPGRNST